jgi:hypothetical protein
MTPIENEVYVIDVLKAAKLLGKEGTPKVAQLFFLYKDFKDGDFVFKEKEADKKIYEVRVTPDQLQKLIKLKAISKAEKGPDRTKTLLSLM